MKRYLFALAAFAGLFFLGEANPAFAQDNTNAPLWYDNGTSELLGSVTPSQNATSQPDGDLERANHYWYGGGYYGGRYGYTVPPQYRGGYFYYSPGYGLSFGYSSPRYGYGYRNYGWYGNGYRHYGQHYQYHHDWHSYPHNGPHNGFHYDPYNGYHWGRHYGPHWQNHHDWHGRPHNGWHCH